MIKIKRADCPRVLRKPKAKAAYRNKRVVKTLWDMQFEKCAYCEMKIPCEGHQKTVDHFRPKGIFKSRVNDWKNLLLVCAQCNGRKSDRFPVELTNNICETKVVYTKIDTDNSGLLIDPSDLEIDPEKHLDFHIDEIFGNDYGMICAKDDCRRGRETIKVIGLDNQYNTIQHREHLQKMQTIFGTLLIARDQKESVVEIALSSQIRMMVSAKGELAAVARAYARKERIDVHLGIPIPTGWECA